MLLVVLIFLLFAFTLVSARLGKTVVIAPISFTAAGVVVFHVAPLRALSRMRRRF